MCPLLAGLWLLKLQTLNFLFEIGRIVTQAKAMAEGTNASVQHIIFMENAVRMFAIGASTEDHLSLPHFFLVAPAEAFGLHWQPHS